MLLKTGQFTKQSATGSQAVTGVGFQPKIVILNASGATSTNTFVEGSYLFWGFAASTVASAQKSLSMYGVHAADPSSVHSGFHSGAVFNDSRSGAFTQLATLSSFDADGFTLNWSVNTTPNYIITYIALAGDDLSQMKVGQFNAATATGNQSITGVGFQPDLLMLLGTGHTADDNAGTSNGVYSYGFARATNEMTVIAGVIEAGVDITKTGTWHGSSTNERVLTLFSPTDATTLTHQATIASMDSDGFTLNYLAATAAATNRVIYLAIKGGRYAIRSLSSPTAGTPPVSQSVSDLGYAPKGALFLSAGHVTEWMGTIRSNFRVGLGLGAADASSNRFCHWIGDEDAATAQVAVSILNDNQVIRVSDEQPPDPTTMTTTQALADLTSLDANGFTLSWAVKDLSNSYVTSYIVMADSPPPERRKQILMDMRVFGTAVFSRRAARLETRF